MSLSDTTFLPKFLPAKRSHAFLMHLAISLLIFLLLAGLIYFIWFPGALFLAAGGVDGILIIAGVDLVLGPLLTLIVYNLAKPLRELKRDLSIIAAIQLSCLIAGVAVVHHARPLAVVHVYDTFYTVTNQDLHDADIDPSVLEALPGNYPKIVLVDVPREKMEFMNLHVKAMLNGDKPLQLQSERYKSMPQDIEELKAVLQGSETGGCVALDLETAYQNGKVCFNPRDFTFSNFVKS